MSDIQELEGALSPRAFCEKYGVGMTRTYEELGSGRLKARKLGRRTLIPVEAARAWFEALPEVAA